MPYVVDDSPERLDRDWIWRMLSQEAYWGLWRGRADVEAQIDGAWRVIGVYDDETGEQCGFARAVSDGVGFAYLADVIIMCRLFEHAGSVKKAISVVKKRNGRHEETIRELRFDADGIHLSEPLSRFRGVLTGVPVDTGNPLSLDDGA